MTLMTFDVACVVLLVGMASGLITGYVLGVNQKQS